jgi:hypothetical protein
MNNQEAKLILQTYRPNGLDASDPFFAEAMEQSRRDPELQKWFAEEVALHARLQARLETAIPVPPELKSNLLALRKTIRPVPWWFQPMNLAAAAAVLIALGSLLLLLPGKASSETSFREAMARDSLQTEDHVVFASHEMPKIRQWLQDRGLPSRIDLPAMLQSGTPQGCRRVDWNGHQATMVCFLLQGGQHMDLFVMDHAALPDFTDHAAPQFAGADGLMTAMWTGGGKVYLLTGQSQDDLEKVLQPTSTSLKKAKAPLET